MAKRCPICNKPISDSAKTCLKHRPGNHVPARTTVVTDKCIAQMDGKPDLRGVMIPLWMISRD